MIQIKFGDIANNAYICGILTHKKNSIMIITIVVIAVIAIFVMSVYNSLVGLRNKVEEAFATMDVYLKKRFDQIPNLVSIVKGYAKHEAETLEKVVKLRTNAATDEEKVEAEKQVSSAIKQLMVTVEAYPELKSNVNFQDLQHQLNEIEHDIANARKYYNGAVRQYNDKVQMFPSSLVASIFGFSKRSMFEVDSAVERENVKIEF